MEEKYSYRLIRDLFAHKDAIFTELKRASALSHSVSVDQRPRAVSTDESNRKANMEARNRAILAAGGGGGSRSRASSPAPGPRNHRRDRSSNPPETRFPIQTSPTASEARHQCGSLGSVARQSLEVPGTPTPEPQTMENGSSAPLQIITNGSTSSSGTGASGEHSPYMPMSATESMGEEVNGGSVEKRNSLGRTAPGRFAAQRKTGGLARMSLTGTGKRDSLASVTSDGMVERPVGVSLVDKAMDD